MTTRVVLVRHEEEDRRETEDVSSTTQEDTVAEEDMEEALVRTVRTRCLFAKRGCWAKCGQKEAKLELREKNFKKSYFWKCCSCGTGLASCYSLLYVRNITTHQVYV